MTTKSEARSILRDIIAAELDADRATLDGRDRLRDLEFDSLNEVSATMAAEDRFGIQIPDAALEAINGTTATVDDLITALLTEIARQGVIAAAEGAGT